MAYTNFFSGIRRRIRCGGIVAVAWLALAASEADAQITYSYPGFPDQRSVQVTLNRPVNGFTGDYAHVSNEASLFLPFHAVADRTVLGSWIAASSRASGRLTQDSVLTSNSIVSSSSASFSASAQYSSEFSWPSYPAANTSGDSSGGVTFFVNQYCRFTLLGNVSANVSSAGGSASIASAIVSVSLSSRSNGRVFGSAEGLLSSGGGGGHLPDSLSHAVSTNGFLDAGIYALGDSSRVVTEGYPSYNNATGSAQVSASTSVSFTVEPMGTKLVGLEVIQTIQDWNNSVPLIAGKPTYVRAHVEPISAPSVPIMNARLRGFVDGFGGTELKGSPLTPLGNGTHTAVPYAASEDSRSNWQATVNFQLPPEWTSKNVRLKMEMDGLVSADASLQQSVVFIASPQLDLRVVKVSVFDGSTPINLPPSSEAIQLEVNRLAELFPITRGAIRLTETSMVISSPDNLSAEEFLEQVKLKRLVEGQSAIYVAAVSGTLSGTLAGIADRIPGNVVTAQIDKPGVLAHEIAHALGEFHPVNTEIFHTFTPSNPDPDYLPETIYASGPTCGRFRLGVPLSRAVNFPFWLGNNARIGPVLSAGTKSQVYGLANGSKPNDIRVISPYESVDLMMGGYCGNEEHWISTHTSSRLRAAILARMPVAPLITSLLVDASSTQPYVAVRGLVDFGNNNVTLLPFVQMSLSSPPVAPTGNTHLLNVYLRDGAATKLAYSIPFTPDTPEVEAITDEPAKGFFIIPVAGVITDIVRVEIKRNETILANRIRSAAAPVIQLLSPNGGEVLGGSPLLARWDASDADGDPLTYQIQFSPDGGQNWQTLAFDWPTNEFSLSGDSLPAGTNALLKVVASDGVNTTASQSTASFTVLNHAPVVVIISPSAGNLFGGNGPIVLEALVSDLEDSAVPTNRVTWTSSLDGFLGNGSRVETKALSLSEGSHLITVTVIDSAGATRVASVQITISRLTGALSITTQPSNQTATEGQPATFQVEASGNTPLSYQWQRNAFNISGANSTSYTVSSATQADHGARFRCVLSNAFGTVTSNEVMLTVTSSLILMTEVGHDSAIAFDSVTMLRDSFPLNTTFNFSSDHRTRIILLAGNADLLPGENSSAVTAQAEDSLLMVYPLTVEFVGKVPGFDWLTQIVVKLPASISGNGDLLVSMTLHGKTSNKVRIKIQ